MTIRSRAIIQTSEASKYMQALCKHWTHKIENITYDDKQGHVPFKEDVKLDMFVEDGALIAQILTPSEEDALRMEGVFDKHIERFAFREPLTIAWTRETLA